MDKKYISCLVNDKVGVCAISLVLDKRHVRNGGKYPIALRFTIDRKRLYYPLGDKYTEKEFDAICRAKNTGRRSNIKSEKETNFECKMLLEQTFKSYVDIVQDLDKTSKLSLNMIMTRLTGKNEEDSFLLVWEDIINNRSVGTADSYTTAKKSFIKYVGVISGFNVSKSTIEKWIKGMENDGFTKTTIGIYLRACRVVWNECTQRGFLSKKEYPFGKDKSLITIPVGSTRKKEYLNVEQMTELYQVFINKKYPESWRKSYIEKVHFSLGLFLVQYLCNGFNLADAARLRYNDYYYISGKQSFQFMRYKTKDRSENNSEVVIPIIEPVRIILSEIAAPEERGGLVFPSILKGEANEVQVRKLIALENSNIQDRMKKLTMALNWEIFPSSTWCRHSFATNLTHAGVPINYISDSMGHSHNENITARYIDIFPYEQQVLYNNKLLNLANEEMTPITKLLNSLTPDELKTLITVVKSKTKE